MEGAPGPGRRFEEDVLLDGRTVLLHDVSAGEGERVARFWRRLDPPGQQRFLELAHLTEAELSAGAVAAAGCVSLAATASRHDDRFLGLAAYRRTGGDAADFFVFVDVSMRGLGLGTVLVRHLAERAHRAGVRTLTGGVRPDEVRMLNLLEQIGLRYERRDERSVVRATFDVEATDRYLASLLRDRTEGARAALDPFLRPHAIAIVGASSDRTSIGGLLLANLLTSGFDGTILPVNPNHPVVQSIVAYPNLAACPVPPDLVVVAVPAPLVAGVVRQAGSVGARAVCVITAGFAEAGTVGVDRQDELRDTAARAGVRIVGPNCMGVLNGTRTRRFNATFSRVFPPAGRIALVSQSGAVGLAALDLAAARGLGLGGFVSLGNAVDLTANDCILYWGDDPDTDVILLYLESVRDPRWFSRVARHVATRKPIVAVKAGRTTAGQRAAASHTAALAAGEVAVDALFRQAGVIRTDTVEEMFEVAALLESQPRPLGRRVAVLTNGGGPGILAADACEANGLLVPELSEETEAQLRAFLPPEAGVHNPVDMIASCTAEQYGRALRVLAAAPEIDAVIVVFIPPIVTEADDVARELAAARPELPKDVPVVAVFMQHEGPPPRLAEAGIPSFPFAENAARALGRVAAWSAWCQRPHGNVLRPEVDVDAARRLVGRALRDGHGQAWLDSAGVHALLDAYGIATARVRLVHDPDEAAEAQREIGGDVVVKIAAPIHKADVGGVRLGVTSPEEAAGAVREMADALTASGHADLAGSWLVQEQISSGLEMIVGVNHDPSFGPLVMVGLGGGLVEVLGDVAVRITPLTDIDVDEMLRSLKAYRLLTGYRATPALDVAALSDVLHRVSALVDDLPEVAELDLNPVFVREHGAVVADARIRLRS